MFSDLREEQQNIIRDLTNKNIELQKKFNDYQDRKIEENANLMKKLDIADKKLTVFSRELEQANKENEKLREINHKLAEEHKTIGQDLYRECVSLRSELTVQKEVAKAFCIGLEQTEKLLGKYKQTLEEIREIINEQKPVSDKAISQSEFTFERLCNYEEKYIKIVDKINEVLGDSENGTTINK